jgi:hypothetical protein
VVKSQKIPGFNNNFLICNRWNGTFPEFNTPSRSPEAEPLSSLYVGRPSYTITKKYFHLKPLGHLKPDFGGMVRGWSPSKIVSGSLDLQPTWSLLLRIKKFWKGITKGLF